MSFPDGLSLLCSYAFKLKSCNNKTLYHNLPQNMEIKNKDSSKFSMFLEVKPPW